LEGDGDILLLSGKYNAENEEDLAIVTDENILDLADLALVGS